MKRTIFILVGLLLVSPLAKFLRYALFLVISVFGVSVGQTAAENEVVFIGYPDSRIISGTDKQIRTVLSNAERTEYRVVITKRDGKYYWTSREDKELIHFESGVFHWFIAPTSGYIKLVESLLVDKTDTPRYVYVEHLTLRLDTYTYWGSGESFNP
jgi:hypothetical protein